ncbi:hypothetical protein AVEN_63058-1 [Araneus ventricosus]|uniref:Uncharacterized protein n=1 Tax=Araneus ventricosus TaxID=182803 RepID=A0A4Y2H1J2_ARAVE|nr:hypothetical protein AVEN_63058-1 [Araneus ventricosus]
MAKIELKPAGVTSPKLSRIRPVMWGGQTPIDPFGDQLFTRNINSLCLCLRLGEINWRIAIVEVDGLCQSIILQYISNMEGGGRQATIDDIPKGNRLSNEMEIVEIGTVVEAGDLVTVSPYRESTVK